MNWYSIIQDSETGVAHVQLGDEIGCRGKSADDLGNELAALQPVAVELAINSIGGDWSTGIKLFKIFQEYDTTASVTLCCSSAVLAAMAAKRIKMLPNARWMIHAPSAFIFGGVVELLETALELERLRSTGAEIISHRTGQTVQTVQGWLSCDTWFSSQEAIECGLADEVITPPRSRRSVAKSHHVSPAKIERSESEKVFFEWLTAFGKLEVSERARFESELKIWFVNNVS